MALTDTNFLEVMNQQIKVAADSWKELPLRIGETDGEALSGQPLSFHGATKRSWTCKTTPILAANYLKTRYLLEGQFQAWPLTEQVQTSITGIRATAGTLTFNAAGGRLTTPAGDMTVGSGSTWDITMLNKLGIYRGWSPTKHGWTIAFWTARTIASDGAPSDGNYFLAATGAVAYTMGGGANPVGVTQYRNNPASPASNPTNTNYSLGNFTGLTSGTVFTLGGKAWGGGNAAKDYQDVFFFPWQMTAAEIAALYHLLRAGGKTTNGLSAKGVGPFVYLSGNCIEDAQPILARVWVDDRDYMNAKLPEDTQHRANNRVLSLRVEEFLPAWY